jgi:DNA-binding ferritin-like protein
MSNEFILNLENKLQGCGTRLKELHWNSTSLSMHKLVDEFTAEFREFEDNLMENAQALFGFIEIGSLNPILPEAKTFLELLEDIRGMLVNIKKESKDSLMWSGIINIVDDFFATINKYIYLTKIIKSQKED